MPQILVKAGDALASTWPAVAPVPEFTFPGTLRGTLTGVLGSEWTLAYPLVSQGLEGWGAKTSALSSPSKAMAIAQSLLEDKDCILQLRSVPQSIAPTVAHEHVVDVSTTSSVPQQ